MCEIVSTTWEKTNELIDGSAISRTFLLVTFPLDLEVQTLDIWISTASTPKIAKFFFSI